jgi:L-tyrosine peroxygenase
MKEPAYGDYSYGLEPLVLPDPDEPWLEIGGREFEFGNVPYRPVALGVDETPSAARAWFRWITGHQLSFLIWRFIAIGCNVRYVASIDSRAIAQLVAGYSASLAYTSLMSPGEYARTVRPAMERTHRAFTGSWASDYRSIRDLIQSPRRAAAMPGTGARELVVRIRECNDVHREVAKRLVPTGVSLLQESGMSTGVVNTQAATDMIYDAFFLVTRRPVSIASALEQFERRVHAVTADLARSDNDAEQGCDGFIADLFGAAPRRLHTALVSAADISVRAREGAVL